MCVCVYVCAHAHKATINEKIGHECQREQGQVHGQLWRQENEGRNYVFIIISKKKLLKQ